MPNKQCARGRKKGCRVTDRETFLEIESQRTRHPPTSDDRLQARYSYQRHAQYSPCVYVWGLVCSKCVVTGVSSTLVALSQGSRFVWGTRGSAAHSQSERVETDRRRLCARGSWLFSFFVSLSRRRVAPPPPRVARGKTRVFHYRCHSTTPQYSTPATLESRRNTSLHTHKIMARRRLA